MTDTPRVGPTLDEQIACVSREIAIRQSVYPKWVQAGKMTRNKMDYELECMRAVMLTLQKLREGR